MNENSFRHWLDKRRGTSQGGNSKYDLQWERPTIHITCVRLILAEQSQAMRNYDSKSTMKLNSISMYLPNRLELSFLVVLALPKACESTTKYFWHLLLNDPDYTRLGLTSRTGLDWSNRSLTFSTVSSWWLVAARNCRTFLDASVFPAPLSPEIRMQWSLTSSRIEWKAASVTANLHYKNDWIQFPIHQISEYRWNAFYYKSSVLTDEVEVRKISHCGIASYTAHCRYPRYDMDSRIQEQVQYMSEKLDSIHKLHYCLKTIRKLSKM